MNARERGFLLLCGHLGNPERKPLTTAQFRTLAGRVEAMERHASQRELEDADLTALGYDREAAERIVSLLSEEELLDFYLEKAARAGCVPITRVSADYPLLLRKRLGLDSPGCLWARGDVTLLTEPAVAVVGSRDLLPENRRFASEAGRQAALQGYVLVSGNARGTDRTAQEACLAAGGRVISVVADELWKQPLRERVLYLSEEDWDEPFSAQRALSRNRCIHALGTKTFVAQTGMERGGTWDGTVKNLRFGWSPVYGFDDGSEGMNYLALLGAQLIPPEALGSFFDLPECGLSLFDR
ncbi:MAG: DNA-processing protein DprA [Firmicutes bacterium]|nr:DNA-processing protein DprA [Bacillota bacterium]